MYDYHDTVIGQHLSPVLASPASVLLKVLRGHTVAGCMP